jgi:ribonuclease HI
VRQVHLWADGSGTVRGNQGGWAAILVDVATGIEREIVGAAVDATNNTMELTAVMRGLQSLTKPCEVTVYSDSQYVIHAFTHNWIASWRRRKWVKVANVALWQELIAAAERHVVKWHHVRGHSGVAYNERCDQLAVAARKDLTQALDDGTAIHLPFEVQGNVGTQLELV